jgi:hypothetical protein
MKLQYTFTRKFFLRGLHLRTLVKGELAPEPRRGGNPLFTLRVEECTFFWGVKYSWGINMAENKEL